MKEVWNKISGIFWIWITTIIFGFCLGKLYTYDSIALDCKILGTFRYANVAFHCKVVAP